MKLNTITELQLQLIINNNLYKKNIIDENTFSKANERLLKMIKTLQVA
ncbi:unknown [Firmicutes bacterium CAG:884]|nr:unknown [Firmicutes bacterium CAG:884]